jgi:hypothetical protein
MATNAVSSTVGVKRFMPSAARSIQEQVVLNGHLVLAALENEPDLVLHFLSQGADPSARIRASFELIPNPAVAKDLQTPENRTVNDNAKVSAKTDVINPAALETISVLHAAIINSCWKVTLRDAFKSTTSKVMRIVKALLEAGANTSQRNTFLACHIPGYNYFPIDSMTPLDFAVRLQTLVHAKLNLACAQELQCLVDLLRGGVSAEPIDKAAVVDRESRTSIDTTTFISLRAMFDSATASFSDIVFECAAEADSVDVDREVKPKRSKQAPVSSSSSSSSSDALSLDSSVAASMPPSNLVHAHRCILSASSPYFRTLFSGSWRDVSDGRIIAKQSASAIRRMLEFVYTGEMTAAQALKLPFEDLVELHEASAEYQIDSLCAMTEAALAQHVTAANLVRMLQLASLHDGTSCTFPPNSSSPQAAASLSSSSSSSFSSSSVSSVAPCVLMNACIAVLKADMALLASDEMVDFLAAHPNLRASLRAALAKKA